MAQLIILVPIRGFGKREGKGNPRLIKNINVFALEQTGGGELLVGSKKGSLSPL